MLRLVCAMALLFTAGEAQALFGWSSKGEDELKEVIQRVGEFSREAELVWMEARDSKQAIDLYQQAIDLCLEAEAKYPKGNLSDVRFRRAFCENQIDQVKFNAATGPQRHVAIMAPAKENSPPSQPSANDTVAAPPPAAATELGLVDSPEAIAEEVAWAYDMLDAGGWKEARDALMKVLRIAPDHRQARLLLAVLECRQQAFQDALMILEDLQAEQEDEVVQLLIAGAFLGTEQPYRAMLELDKLLTKNPAHPDALMNMAYLSLEMSAKPAEAEMYYRLAVKCGAPRDTAFEKRLDL